MDIDTSFSNRNGIAGPGFVADLGAAQVQSPPQSFGAPPIERSQLSLLGLVVPGAPVRTDFQPADATGTKFTMKLTSPGDLPSPLSIVNELCFFLLPGATLPPNAGILIYYQLEVSQNEQSGFELLGSLTPPSRPSDIFRTGWSEHGQFLSVGPNQVAIVNIGISIEPMETVQNLTPSNGENNLSVSSAATSRRPFVAQKIAQDLFNFMQSFDTGGVGAAGQNMVVPKNIFDRWWNRFEMKIKRDPNFFLKNNV
jgi:hypothetical protein